MTGTMQIGRRSDAVRGLQEQRRTTTPILKTDGVLRLRTERAVRAFPKRVGQYPPDGPATERRANAGQKHDMMPEIEKQIRSAREVFASLVRRRGAAKGMFPCGEYR